MTSTPERTPLKRDHSRPASSIVRDGLRLAGKIERLDRLSPTATDFATTVEDYHATPPTPIEVEFIDTPADTIAVSSPAELISNSERAGRTRRLALGARALAGSVIERFGTPSGSRHRARRIGLAGLNAFRPTGGSHKRIPGAHKSVAIKPGKHRA